MENPTTSPPTEHKIIVGIDGSNDSADALLRAVEIGEALHCGVHAIITYTIPSIPGSSMIPTIVWDPRRDAVVSLEKTIARAFSAGVPELLSYSAIEGPAAKTLIGASKNATMLVVGSRGHGAASSILLGSVSVACAEQANCPVLVIH